MDLAAIRQLYRTLDELLREQERVISRKQLLAAGVSYKYAVMRLHSGRWQPGFPGTYVTHNGDVSYLARVWSALLYAGEGAMVSHETAAFLHELVDRAPPDVHVTVPSTRRVDDQPGLVVHLSSRAPEQEQFLSIPPRTTVEETVLDIAAKKKRAEHVVGVLTNACQRRKTAPVRLRAALALRKKMPHRALIDETLVAIAEGVHSVLEWRYRRDVEQRHGLPKPTRQRPRRRDGKREFLDVGYEEYGVIVELDGEEYHDFKQRARDRARDRASAVRGEVTLRYTWRDIVLRPCEVAAEIAAVLRTRGWKGELRSCRRCRGR